MEFFERAHVHRKESSKKESKSEEAVKKQLKQLLHAYKKGNNQEIRNFSEKEIRYDTEDMKSISEFSDFSFQKYAETTQNTEDSLATEESHSNTEHNSSSVSLSTSKSDTVNENLEDSLESITEELKSQSLSSTENDFTSTFDSSIISEEYSDSDFSIPSSLQSGRGGSTEDDDDDFDADGALASKIMEELSKKQKSLNKRKLVMEDKKLPKEDIKQSKKEKKKVEKIAKHKKVSQNTEKDLNRLKEITEESVINETIDSDSCPYISVSVTDMQSQSLDDIVGDYVHSTVKNLPSQKQHIVSTPLSKYTILDEMISGEVAEDISSVVPEIDGELMEELSLGSNFPEKETDMVLNPNIESEDICPISIYNGINYYIIIMKHPAELYIHGKVTVIALSGTVEVFGYTLQNDFVDVYAPYCYYAHCIKTIEKQNEFSGLFDKLTHYGLTTLEAQEIMSKVRENDAIISLSNLNNPKMDFVDTYFGISELFTRRNDQTPEFLKKVAENLGCSLYLNPPKKYFEERSTWDEVVACGMNGASRGIVCGGKGLGKSTFLRYYVNRMLANGPVLVIDLDPGQAEFTVPGNISVNVVNKPLLGPNFTHLRKPDRMLNIGMISTMDQPQRYISAINQLISYCHNNHEYTHLPWIVNTMGMCNDIGLKFLTYAILQMKPTFLYQIDSDIPKKRFQFELQPNTFIGFYEQNRNDRLLAQANCPNNLQYTFIKSNNEETPKGSNSALSPRDERYLKVLAYFSRLVEIHYGKGILEIVPYEVSIAELNIGVNVNIPHQYVTKVINGKIIALCQLPSTDKGKVFNLRDNVLLCHGYGLIRSIDFQLGLLYILTPVPVATLSSVNTLVYTDWMPELHGMEKELPNGTIIPYRLSTLENPVMTRPRRRFNPIQLIKETRKA